MIFEKMPSDFDPKFEVVTCHIWAKDRYLIVKRSLNENYSGKWCSPGGSIDEGETKEQALIREIEEETGIILAGGAIEFKKTVYVRYPEFDFVFHIYSTAIPKKLKIILNREHDDFAWVTLDEAFIYDMVPDEKACLELIYPK